MVESKKSKPSKAAKKQPPKKPKRTFLQKISIRAYYKKRRDAKKLYLQEHPLTQLPSVWSLSRESLSVLWNHKGLFIGISLIYGFLDLIFARGLASATSVSDLKSDLIKVGHGHQALSSSISSFITLGNSTNASTNTPNGVYQFILVVVASLAIIWALRQVTSGRKVKIREAYYRGMYPFVPFLVVIVCIGLQLLPLVVGATLYTQVVNNGISVGELQKLIWLVVFMLLSIWSLYYISSSTFALYVSTRPLMTPLKALKVAKSLVHYQRMAVLLKLLYLPIVLIVLGIIIIVPVTVWLTPLTAIVYFLMTTFIVVIVNSYLFNLYMLLAENNE